MITALVQAGQLPGGTCYQNEQQRLNGTAENLIITFPISASVFNYGSTEPDADNRPFPWYKLNPDGSIPFPFWYSYINGAWVSPHPIAPSDPSGRFYFGTLASIETYDGGQAGDVGDAAGPMWEIATQLTGRLPLGVSGSFPQGSTGGAATHTLTSNEVPATPINGTGGFLIAGAGGGPNTTVVAPSISGTTVQPTVAGGGQPHSIMNPYYAGYWLRRTARKYYVA